MRFIHLADLHIGKTVHEFSMLDDQRHILNQVVSEMDQMKQEGRPVNAVLVAGDVFDRSVPSADALSVFDAFLNELAARELPVYIISGNHDSAERLAFGQQFMEKGGIFFSRPLNHACVDPDDPLDYHVLCDEFGEVRIYMLPFIRPIQVRQLYPEAEIHTWTDAVREVLRHVPLDPTKRNVLMAHQFVTGAETCDSEELSIGGADNVSADVFDAFDYVALGHLHGPQRATREHIRYAGSPLKYSFSEERHHKSFPVVTFGEKRDAGLCAPEIELVPLKAKRDLKTIKGTYMDLTSSAYYKRLNREHYYRVVLTDEMDQVDAIRKLRTIYPNIMLLQYDNLRTRGEGRQEIAAVDSDNHTPLELAELLYEKIQSQPMNEQQRAYLADVMERVFDKEVAE